MGLNFWALGCPGVNFLFRTWSYSMSNRRGWRAQNASKTFTLGLNWWPWGEVKRSNIIKFQLQSHFQRFYAKLLACCHKYNIENILNGIFILLPGSCTRGWTWACWGSKTLAWGFAMAPHRLRVLVTCLRRFILLNIEQTLLLCMGQILCHLGEVLSGYKEEQRFQ